MNIETQSDYQKIISDDFTGMKQMLDEIHKNITEHPVYNQLEFIKPLKLIIFEAWQDSLNSDDKFLNKDSEAIKID